MAKFADGQKVRVLDVDTVRNSAIVFDYPGREGVIEYDDYDTEHPEELDLYSVVFASEASAAEAAPGEREFVEAFFEAELEAVE